ncbi:uncharacterized protein F5Z01DRAFT_675048 [Emericellopsis atlantica]|uniref:DUF7136 domain-containing protein n=1 Tax=Emericellopsis atlantica TaxID=2614577 RepID=A0A9P7ZK83_9HYPO|nr:uncharacterized protein F5Z01DRAFT_675048 [Emericellopsis atlantica]KAG9253644.1 hypothetical protein F5Z01DRAFT_675048 [Emericellopsis atlantica]
MYFVSHALWTVAGLCAYQGAVATAAGVLEASLVFPRNNTTYEPSKKFPIVFAVQNSQLLEYLQLSFDERILNRTKQSERTRTFDNEYSYNYTEVDVVSDGSWKINWWDVTASQSDPYLHWFYLDLRDEGPFSMGWWVEWAACNETEDRMGQDSYTTFGNHRFPLLYEDVFVVEFETKKGGQKVDLVSGTENNSDDDCPADGVAIEVSDEVANATVYGSVFTSTETCAALVTSTPTPTANPCKIKIDKATVESMDAHDLEEACKGTFPPAECPEDEDHAVHMLAAEGLASLLAAAVGAALFLF